MKIGDEMKIFKEILDTQHDYTEDDFAESVYVYINAIKDLMAKYVEKEIE